MSPESFSYALGAANEVRSRIGCFGPERRPGENTLLDGEKCLHKPLQTDQVDWFCDRVAANPLSVCVYRIVVKIAMHRVR